MENLPLLLKFVDELNICSVPLPAIGKKFTRNFMKKPVKAAHQLGIKSLLVIRFAFSSGWLFYNTRKGAHLGTCLLTLEILFDNSFRMFEFIMCSDIVMYRGWFFSFWCKANKSRNVELFCSIFVTYFHEVFALRRGRNVNVILSDYLVSSEMIENCQEMFNSSST